MALIGTLVTTLTANTSNFQKGMKRGEKSTKSFTNNLTSSITSIGKFTAGIAAAGIAIGSFAVLKIGKDALKAASDFEEAGQKFSVVFASVIESANTTRDALAQSFGLSKTAATDLLGATGDLLTGFGFTDKAALELSNSIQELAVDLASFNNLEGGATRASNILTKALLGERDALTSLGVKILEADLKTELLIRGQQNLTGSALLAAKAQATYDLILRQTTKAQGDFARSSDSLANLQKTLSSKIDDVSVSLGTRLLPLARAVTSRLIEMTDEAQSFIDTLGDLDEDVTKNVRVLVVQFSKLAGVIDAVSAAWNTFSGLFRSGISLMIKGLVLFVEAGNKINDLLGVENLDTSLLTAIADELQNLAETDIEEAKVALDNFLKGRSGQGIVDEFDAIAKKAKELSKNIEKANIEKKKFVEPAPVAGLSKAFKKLAEFAKSVFTETRTPLEKFNIEMKKLQDAFKAGAFDLFGGEETFARKSKQLKDALQKQLDTLKIDKAFEKAKDLAKSIFKDTRTPLEKFNKEVKELKKLLDSGALEDFGGLDTFNRKMEQLKETLKRDLGIKDIKNVPVKTTDARQFDIKNLAVVGNQNKVNNQQLEVQKKQLMKLDELINAVLKGNVAVVA